jgi:hypothetical protein
MPGGLYGNADALKALRKMPTFGRPLQVGRNRLAATGWPLQDTSQEAGRGVNLRPAFASSLVNVWVLPLLQARGPDGAFALH